MDTLGADGGSVCVYGVCSTREHGTERGGNEETNEREESDGQKAVVQKKEEGK